MSGVNISNYAMISIITVNRTFWAVCHLWPLPMDIWLASSPCLPAYMVEDAVINYNNRSGLVWTKTLWYRWHNSTDCRANQPNLAWFGLDWGLVEQYNIIPKVAQRERLVHPTLLHCLPIYPILSLSTLQIIHHLLQDCSQHEELFGVESRPTTQYFNSSYLGNL